MNKKWLRRILAMAMVFSLAAGSWVTGYADDGEGNIVISGDGVYEVEAGKTTKIELQVKNKGTGTAVKMFTVAGPVIVFGTAASVVYGLVLYLLA